MTQQIADTVQVLTIEPMLQSLSQFYIFRRPEEVSQFLSIYPFLAPLLMEAYGRIREHFGQQSQVVLEVVTDPDRDDDQELFALVQTDLSPDDAWSCLERFDQEWWLDTSSQAHCLLNIDVEHI